ncbi:MAG: hypothetical protein KGY66_04765 [Candidatus Thermoplasmatota archaeon]|nr:hypothetical protein [Candidatus Thermoplasmatota archaeon]MBS3790209.1 hypothetical protein [Candidatus Thermoplasmatota archaeon]
MLDDLLEKKLKRLKNEDILVVMDDGLAFLGELQDFDTKTLVLRKVYQAPAKKIDWKELPSKSDDVRKDIDDRKVGFIDWTKINLEEVYINISHTTRIWKWTTKGKKGQTKRDFREAKRPVYTKDQERPEERGASIGDIPDKYPG